MPAEMRAVLDKFFTPRHYKKGKTSAKKLGIFRKKLIVYYFSISTIVDPLKGEARGKCLQCLSSLYNLLGSSSYFLKLNT